MSTDASFQSVPLEDVRSYWNRRPCNIRHSRQPLGTREYFDDVEERRYFVEPHIPEFAEFFRWRGKRVLEIGCGIGTDTLRFAQAGARVTAVDLSEESLALARTRAQVFGLADKIEFYAADAENLASVVPAAVYDLVYSFGVIHHTPHPERAIEQVHRYMGPDSVLKLMLYNRWSWKVVWILLTESRGAFWKLDELVARRSEAQTGCPVTYTYSEASAAKLLEHFEILDSAVRFIFPYRIADYVEYRYVRQWYFRILPSAWFRWLERRIGWHRCITAKLPPGAV